MKYNDLIIVFAGTSAMYGAVDLADKWILIHGIVSVIAKLGTLSFLYTLFRILLQRDLGHYEVQMKLSGILLLIMSAVNGLYVVAGYLDFTVTPVYGFISLAFGMLAGYGAMVLFGDYLSDIFNGKKQSQ